MKKLAAGLLAAIGFSLFAGCSNVVESGNYPVLNSNRGSIVVSVGNKGRYLNASDISTATIRVYDSKYSFVEKTSVGVTNGTGSVSIGGIPVGKNRVVEITGFKADGVEGKRLYHVMDVASGVNSTGVIVDGPDSAKGKAYLSLIKEGIDVSSVTLSGFVSGKSSYYFDADAFALAYKTSSSAKISDYYKDAATVTFSKLNKAGGYEIWIADPLSSKITVSSDAVTSASISNVAQGKWNVYVNDGTASKKVGVVTVSGTAATYSDLIGKKDDLLAGKTVIFVKSSSVPTLYAWIAGSSTVELTGGWSANKKMDSVPEGYMNDPSGWYMRDVTSTYDSSKGTINIITIINGSQSKDIKTGKSGTFWYDSATGELYDADPTVPAIDTDVTLSDILVNGVSVGASASEYTVGKAVGSVLVEVVAKSSNAVVSVSDGGSASIAQGSSKVFTIYVSNNGNSASYELCVSRAAANDTSLSSIVVNGKSAVIDGKNASVTLNGSESSVSIESIIATAVDSDAKISYSATTGTISDGNSKAFTITVTNGGSTVEYVLSVSYAIKAESQYYWTNKNGFGSNKTISSWADWTVAEQIAQCAAYDDPRTWNGYHEVAYDVYALYAAYDDTNLYIMTELVNLADGRASFDAHSYAGSDNGAWWNRDCPIGFILNTGKGTTSTAPIMETTGSPIWGSVNFTDSEGFDWLLYASSKYGEFNGRFVGVGTPGFFHVKPTGYFSYDDDYCLSANTGSTTGTSGITIRSMTKCAVSKTIYYESTPTGNRANLNQTGEDLLASETFSSCETNELDMSYWYTIPLATLGIDKAYIESHGIGVRQITPNGGSLMDCCPWDPSMVDVATEPCSDDESTSHEKEDVDAITSAQARVGR